MIILPSGAKQISRDDGHGKSTRFYEVPGGNAYPSVTSLLKATPKPALLPWTAKTERELVVSAAGVLWDDLATITRRMSRGEYMDTLRRRLGKEKAYQIQLARANDIGSQAHGWIDWETKRRLGWIQGAEPPLSESALWATMAWQDWAKSVEFSPVYAEQIVWSDKHQYAGTMDWFGEITHKGNKICVVGDYKTGKAIYPEYGLQISAYAMALAEMGHAETIGGCVVRLPKSTEDPQFEVKIFSADDLASLFSIFLKIAEIWRWVDSYGGWK